MVDGRSAWLGLAPASSTGAGQRYTLLPILAPMRKPKIARTMPILRIAPYDHLHEQTPDVLGALQKAEAEK